MINALRVNALNHKNYKLYMPMDRALSFLLSGYLYLSIGEKWLDDEDHKQMENTSSYGRCFVCSTMENIAFWQLYGGYKGENGAMLNFPGSIIKNLVKTESAELGKYEKNIFKAYKDIYSGKDFDSFMTDIVYTQDVKGKKGEDECRLSLWDEHKTVSKALVSDERIYKKNYIWQNEKESRYIIQLKGEAATCAKDEKLGIIRVAISEKDKNQMKKNFYQSPLYCGKVDFGNQSNTYGKLNLKKEKEE
ncbi:MAG: hypothetical protein IJJ67_01880 [Oscillospiraceae bacterium]|nr:hypothetical protein [Oscillospiraceae bacterium]